MGIRQLAATLTVQHLTMLCTQQSASFADCDRVRMQVTKRMCTCNRDLFYLPVPMNSYYTAARVNLAGEDALSVSECARMNRMRESVCVCFHSLVSQFSFK